MNIQQGYPVLDPIQPQGQYIALTEIDEANNAIPSSHNYQQSDLSRVNFEIVTDYKCYNIWLIVMIIFAGLSGLAELIHIRSLLELIPIGYKGFMVYTYYQAHNAKKNLDQDQQKTSVFYMKIITYIGLGYVIILAIVEVVAFIKLSDYIKEHKITGADIPDEYDDIPDDIEPKTIIKALGAYLLLFLIYAVCTTFVLPGYLWKRGEKLYECMQRRNMILGRSGVQL